VESRETINSLPRNIFSLDEGFLWVPRLYGYDDQQWKTEVCNFGENGHAKNTLQKTIDINHSPE
jgi:hypothetical protein